MRIVRSAMATAGATVLLGAAQARQPAASPPAEKGQAATMDRVSEGYVINDNLGKGLVRRYIESRGTPDHPDARWKVFEQLLSSPRLPSGLAAAK